MSAVLRLGGFFDFDNQLDRLNQIKQEFEDPAIWNDQTKAESLGRERARLEDTLLPLDQTCKGLADAADLLELALEEGDTPTHRCSENAGADRATGISAHV
jgi:peptide chain release factor 2